MLDSKGQRVAAFGKFAGVAGKVSVFKSIKTYFTLPVIKPL